MTLFISPRSGGPYNQLRLLSQKLAEHNISSRHIHTGLDWLKAHFATETVVSVVPFLFRPANTFILNLRGDFRRQSYQRQPLNALYPRNIKQADKIVVPSYYLKELLGLSSAIVIPNVISRTYTPLPFPTDGGRHLATAANFDFPAKLLGLKTVLSVLAEVATKVPRNLSLTIYGRGRYLNSRRLLTEINPPANLRLNFAGYKPRLAEQLRRHHLFLYWSTFDNLPNVLLDAIAAGLPVVANQHGAFNEILGPEVPLSLTRAEFADRTLRLLTDSSALRLAREQSLARVSLFTPPKIILQWIKILR